MRGVASGSQDAFSRKGLDLADWISGVRKDFVGVLAEQGWSAIDAAAAAFGEPKPGPDQGQRAVSTVHGLQDVAMFQLRMFDWRRAHRRRSGVLPRSWRRRRRAPTR